jgi:hypothetical protein
VVVALEFVDAAAQDKADKEAVLRLQEMLRQLQRPAQDKAADAAVARADAAAVVAALPHHLRTGSFTSKRLEKTQRENRRPSSSMARSKTWAFTTDRLSVLGLREQ